MMTRKEIETKPNLGSGLTGGSHGTSQPYTDYRVDATTVARLTEHTVTYIEAHADVLDQLQAEAAA